MDIFQTICLVIQLIFSIYTLYSVIIKYINSKIEIYRILMISNVVNIGYCLIFLLINLEIPNIYTLHSFYAFAISIYYLLFAARAFLGRSRNYTWVQNLQIILITLFVFNTWFTPEDFIVNTYYIVNELLVVFLITIFSLAYVLIDNYIYVIKKNKNKKYKSIVKRQLFTIVLFMIILSLVLFVKWENFWPLIIVSTIFQIYLTFNIDFLLFIAPINPYFIDVASTSGVPLYSQNLTGGIENENLLHGALTALNTIFTESISKSASIEHLSLEGFNCHVIMKEEYFIVLIDKTYSKFIRSSLELFETKIAPILNEFLKDWDGIAEKNDVLHYQIENTFETVFAYLPEIRRIAKKKRKIEKQKAHKI